MEDFSPPDQCKRIGGMPGPEDFELIREKGKTYLIVTSIDRREPGSIGKLFYLDLDQQDSLWQPKELQVDQYPPNFRPHGISSSLYKGKLRIYVISHIDSSLSLHSIEVFEKESESANKWKYVKSLKDSLLCSPNDLFAINDEKLLISNDGQDAKGFFFYWNFLTKRKTADITYYENGKFYETNEKLAFGNGIWYDESEKKLYRSSHIEKAIFVYKAKWVENHPPILELIYKVSFPGGPDNIIKFENNFYTTVHPDDFAFLGHAGDKSKISPSMAYKFQEDFIPELIYANKGDQISAASTAVILKGNLILSQVFEDYLLTCKIKK